MGEYKGKVQQLVCESSACKNESIVELINEQIHKLINEDMQQ